MVTRLSFDALDPIDHLGQRTIEVLVEALQHVLLADVVNERHVANQLHSDTHSSQLEHKFTIELAGPAEDTHEHVTEHLKIAHSVLIIFIEAAGNERDHEYGHVSAANE